VPVECQPFLVNAMPSHSFPWYWSSTETLRHSPEWQPTRSQHRLPFASLKREHSFGPQTFLKTKINTKKQSKIEVQAMADGRWQMADGKWSHFYSRGGKLLTGYLYCHMGNTVWRGWMHPRSERPGVLELTGSRGSPVLDEIWFA
jgi:hypothetical protein